MSIAGVAMRRIGLPCSRGELLQEVIGEQQDVGLPLAQRRHEDGEDVQAVVEILAEGAVGHRRLERLVGRGDQAHVRP